MTATPDTPRTPGADPREPDAHVIPTARLKGFAPERKAAYVEEMFDRVAPRYDLMNRLMTFGLDTGWRRYVVAQAAPPVGGVALDVATGTGDIALDLARAMRGRGLVVGSDFSLPMMRPGPPKAARRRGGRIVRFLGADALALPFADDTFDCITTGFAMRNVTDIERAFREMRRVVKPGGRVVCLEVAKPGFAPIRWGHAAYFNHVVPLVGLLVTGQREAYTYLPESAKNFPPPPRLKEIMERAGLRDVGYKLVGFGAAAVHTGIK